MALLDEMKDCTWLVARRRLQGRADAWLKNRQGFNAALTLGRIYTHRSQSLFKIGNSLWAELFCALEQYLGIANLAESFYVVVTPCNSLTVGVCQHRVLAASVRQST